LCNFLGPLYKAEAEAETGSIVVDPLTGDVNVSMVRGNRGDVTIRREVSCDYGDPISATLRLVKQFGAGTSYYPMTLDSASNTYVATIMQAAVDAGTLGVQATCPNEDPTEPPITSDEDIGRIVLYDPSGIISNASTQEPIVNAQVDLFRVPDWEPKTDVNDTRENTCHTPATRPGSWDILPAARALDETLGVHADPNSGRIDPALNPQRTNQEGRYGWNVAKGCWYIVVHAEGYAAQVSPVVGVPPEVTDLHLALTPDATPKPEVRFSEASYTVAEDDQNATIAVSLSAPTTELVTVEYTTSDGTATAGSDYEAANGTLTFLPGVTEATFAISITADGAEAPAEADETVLLTLREPVNAVLGEPASATLTIEDDTPTVTNQHQIFLPFVQR
jgi:hypothetical protein